MLYRLIIERIISLIISLFLSSLIVFMIMQASPVDPISLLLKTPSQIPIDKQIRDNKIQHLKEELGLNDSSITQYFRWLNRIFHWDIGKSFLTGEKISKSIARTLPNSILLALFSTFVEITLALIFGIISVLNYRNFLDSLIRFFCILLKSIPFFAISILVLTVFSTKLFLYEISLDASLSRAFLPAITVGISLTPKLTRLIRIALLDELGKIYIVDAMSKGYGKWKIISYALRNAGLPIVTALSISFAGSIGGMVVTETIFSWPGIGNYALNGVLKLDYFAVQAYILVTTAFVLFLNFLSDIAYIFLNPQIRRGTH